MKVVKSFDEYVLEGVARKVSSDKQRAENLLLESERKYSLLQRTVEVIGVDDNSANDYIEYCYNIMMFIIRAKMLEQGFSSSGEGAHEAEVSFARNVGFSESEVQTLNQLRYFRNGILYYGKRFDSEYAKKIIQFTKRIRNSFR